MGVCALPDKSRYLAPFLGSFGIFNKVFKEENPCTETKIAKLQRGYSNQCLLNICLHLLPSALISVPPQVISA